MKSLELKKIATLYSDFPDKFGIPRQSGRVNSLRGEIVFEPKYRNPDAVRGLEGFSHIWIIWEFSQSIRDDWSPTVRPPRLGGNARMGVFATRSPFRPNPIGLSCVKLENITVDNARGPILTVCGADIMNGTPIYDIKPYLPHSDLRPDATGGFAEGVADHSLSVDIPQHLLRLVPEDKRDALVGILSDDPRPSYINDPQRVYGFGFAGMEIRFSVDGEKLTVCEINI